jgi:hypothetical protein
MGETGQFKMKIRRRRIGEEENEREKGEGLEVARGTGGRGGLERRWTWN